MPDDLHFLHGNHFARCVATVDKVFEYHTLQVIGGGVELFYGDTRHELRGPHAWTSALGPRVRFHPLRPGRPWDHRYVACTGPLAARWHAEGFWPVTPQPLTPADRRALARRLDELLAHAFRPGRLARLRAINLLEALLLQLAELRAAAPPPDAQPWLADVRAALADFTREPDYAALARRHRMSLTTLRRRFHAATGHALHTHRLDLRIHAARRLLTDTDQPLKQIADALGYRDAFYFNRQFTQHAGVPPGAFRHSRLRATAPPPPLAPPRRPR